MKKMDELYLVWDRVYTCEKAMFLNFNELKIIYK